MKKENNSKTEERKQLPKSAVITISVISAMVVCALILCLSCLLPGNKGTSDKKNMNNSDSAARDYLASSDAVAGENSGDVLTEITAEEVAGLYVDKRDGWSYKFDFAPDASYDGTFYAAFEDILTGSASGTGNSEMLVGNWKLADGEIKLFSSDEYQSSLWACGDYIVDSQVYFVGNINLDADMQQAVFVCKDAQNGEARVLNIYNDGKVIMELLSSASSDAHENQLVAGTYEKNDDIITITINGTSQDFYVVDGGLAKWIYTKKID
ncbi:MAG: hypothetical protein II998_07950 [Clostridia bacterium]|nr:hypothetical protein [Clostridia bacterium]